MFQINAARKGSLFCWAACIGVSAGYGILVGEYSLDEESLDEDDFGNGSASEPRTSSSGLHHSSGWLDHDGELPSLDIRELRHRGLGACLAEDFDKGLWYLDAAYDLGGLAHYRIDKAMCLYNRSLKKRADVDVNDVLEAMHEAYRGLHDPRNPVHGLQDYKAGQAWGYLKETLHKCLKV